MSKVRFGLFVALISVSVGVQSRAVVVDFTGGTVTRLDASTQTTNNSAVWDNVNYYDEGGFRLDFLPNSGSAGFATQLGDYYIAGNDVAHAHWFTGNFGGVAQINITKIGGGTFDFNYFLLTSNTDTGDEAASGNELTFIQGFNSNVPTGPAVLLPPEDWGFPGTGIFLGPNFNAVDQVNFMVANPVDCFGMDDFYIDEQFPEPSSFAVLSILGATIASRRGRR